MRVGEPVHAVKFMVKVRQEHMEEAVGILQNSVAPALKKSGFREVLVITRHRQLEKLDPEGPGVVGSPTLARLLENAPSDAPGYARDLRALHQGLVRGVNSFAHAMAQHHKKKRRPEEYEALRRELYAEENRLRVAGYQLDCYALYKSEADLKADTLNLEGKKMFVPDSARFLAEQLEGLLFLRLEGFHQTVVQRALPGPPPVGEGLHVAQALAPVLLRCVRELTSWPGFAGCVVLRCRPQGFSGNFGWSPSGLRQHRGDEPDPDHGGLRELPTDLHQVSSPYELVMLWLTETDALAGVERLAGSAPEALGDPQAKGRVLSGIGKLVLRA